MFTENTARRMSCPDFHFLQIVISSCPHYPPSNHDAGAAAASAMAVPNASGDLGDGCDIATYFSSRADSEQANLKCVFILQTSSSCARQTGQADSQRRSWRRNWFEIEFIDPFDAERLIDYYRDYCWPASISTILLFISIRESSSNVLGSPNSRY